MKKLITMASAALLLTACGNSEKEYDATGTFEATETTVSAEQNGTLLTFAINRAMRSKPEAKWD